MIAAALGADVRGMTVSCPTWGWEWGTDEMAQTLSELQTDGINWISIHPYARIRADGTVSFRRLDPADPPRWLTRPIEEAHARGMKILIKPHLAYWGSPFSWRGAIAFDDPGARARFFASYRDWVLAIAALVPGADGLVVGTELGGLSGHETEWRSVIASIRGVYRGPLTYAANWDEVGRVAFWDALDVIGVQAYFPILPGAEPGVVPSDEALDQGWDRVLADLRALHRATGKHVVFTELGYDASDHAARTPWAGGKGRPGSPLQLACLRASMRAIDREPAVIGAFLWKWFPGEVQSGDFRMSAPPLREAIRDAWREPEPR